MILPIQDSNTVVPNMSDIQADPSMYKGVPDNLGIFGGQSEVLPAQQDFDLQKMLDDSSSKPASFEAQARPITFNWQESQADRYVQSDYIRQLGFDPYAGTVNTAAGPYNYNEQRYGQVQTFSNTLKKAAGGFWALTKNTFMDTVEGEGRLANALFHFGPDYFSKMGERLIGTPEELMQKDEEQKELFNKYAIFHTAESDKEVFSKQFLGDIITQGGFSIGPAAEFIASTALTMGISTAVKGFAKGAQFSAKAVSAAELAARTVPVAERINDARKLGSLTSNTSFFKEMIGGAKQAGKWGLKQLNPLTGAEEVAQAIRTGGSALDIGVTSAGALKRAFGQANMAFSEARFESAGTYGQVVGDMIAKHKERTGKDPDEATIQRMQEYAYNAATDNFIVNAGIIMGMNSLQFGNMFSKFSSSSKLLRAAMETGAEGFTVEGKIAEKAATKAYKNAGIFSNIKNIRKDFGLGTALSTVGKKALTGTVAKFEFSEGVQELLQEQSNKALSEYYTNLYDGRKDLEGASLADANWQKGLTDQFNLDGWKTFLMGAVTGMLMSPLQSSVMRAAKSGYSRINDEYKKEVDGYEKAVQANIDLQNAFYQDPAKGLNEAIKNFKIQAYAGKQMEEALQNGDKYTFFNAKDDAFASTVNAAIKTNMLPSLVDSIREFASQMTDEEIVEAFPALMDMDNSPAKAREYLSNIATDVENYNKNWERLKEEFGHLVLPEIYRANKEDYAKALMAKRALDEAIEILATTDYKATNAIKRAAEIKSKIAGIQGLGGSASEAFDVLLSDTRTDLKLMELAAMLSVAEGIDHSAATKQQTESYKKQMDALIAWKDYKLRRDDYVRKAGKDKYEDISPEELDEVHENMSKAFEEYIIAHNSLSGPFTDTIDRASLKKMFVEFGQYSALNRDVEHYTEAMNILADPKNFEVSYAIIKGALEEANERLKEANTQEGKEKVDAEFGRTTEPTEETTNTGTATNVTEEEQNEEVEKRNRQLIADKLQEIENKKQSLARKANIEKAIIDNPSLIDIPSFVQVKYNSQKGTLEYDEESNTLYFNSLAGKSYTIPKINGSYEAKAYEFGIFPIETLYNFVEVKENAQGQFVLNIYGNEYINLYTDPLMAINTDSEGNVISVDLSTNNNNKSPRNFKGENSELANIIAYQILLYTYEKERQSRELAKSRETTTREDLARKEQMVVRRDQEKQKNDQIGQLTADIKTINKEEEELLLLQALIDAKNIEEIEEIKSILTEEAKTEYASLIEDASKKFRKKEETTTTSETTTEEKPVDTKKEQEKEYRATIAELRREWHTEKQQILNDYKDDGSKPLTDARRAEREKLLKDLETNYTNAIADIQDRIDALYATKSTSTGAEEVKEEATPVKLVHVKSKLGKINNTLRITGATDKKAAQEVLDTVPAKDLKAGMKLTVTKNASSISIKQGGENTYQVVDNRGTAPKIFPSADGTYTLQEAQEKKTALLASYSFVSKGISNPYLTLNRQKYKIEVYYQDTFLGYMAEPDMYNINFGQGNVPVSQLKPEQFSYIYDVPASANTASVLQDFKDNYVIGTQFQSDIDEIIGERDSIELYADEIPFIPVVSEGSIELITEDNWKDRKALGDILRGDMKLVGVYDTINDKMLVGNSDLREEADTLNIRTGRQYFGSFMVGIKPANSKKTKWVQGKSRVITNDELTQKLKKLAEIRGILIGKTALKEAVDANALKPANDILNSMFITMQPINAYFYITQTGTGKYTVKRYTRVGKEVISDYITVDETFSENPEVFRKQLTRYIKKLLRERPLNTPSEFIDNIEIKENNIKENITSDMILQAGEAAAMSLQVAASFENILTYINDKANFAVKSNDVPVPVNTDTTPSINGGTVYTLPVQPSDVPVTVVTEEPTATGTIADEITDLLGELKANKKAKTGKSTKGSKKKITVDNIQDYVASMEEFRTWMQENLPQVTVEEVDGIIERLSNGNNVVGEFFTKLIDTNELRGTIRTSPQAAFKYHEAFHAVFRLFLPQERINELLAAAAKESPVTASKLQEMRNMHPEYMAMPEEELIDRYYEEYLADKFDAWMKNRNTKTSNGIKAFFAKLWDVIKEVIQRVTKQSIPVLFRDINKGSFRNVQVQPNYFTNETAFTTSLSSVKKVIVLGTTTIEDPLNPGREIEIENTLPQSTADTLTGTISALFFQALQTDNQSTKREILEDIIGKYAELYNPYKEEYQKKAALIENKEIRRMWLKDVASLYFLFTDDDAKQSLIEAIDVRLRINGLKQELDDDIYESTQEDVGERNVDNFNKDLGTIGDYKSLAKYLRMYIAGTTIDFVDEYGNSQLVPAVKDAEGNIIVPPVPLVQAVNPNEVYNGLLKVLSNNTNAGEMLLKLDRYEQNGGNPATTAFIRRLKNDTGLKVNEDGSFTVNRQEQAILVQQIIKGFGLYEVDHLFILVNKDKKYIIREVNKDEAANKQLNKWSNAFTYAFWNKRERIQDEVSKRSMTRTASKPLEEFSKALSNPASVLDETGNAEEKAKNNTFTQRISNQLKENLGIYLHPNYLKFSLISAVPEDKRTIEQQLYVSDFQEVIPLSVSMINDITSNLQKANIFSQEVGVSVKDTLSTIAVGNAYFDETIDTMSYTSSDKQKVYAHQLPSFYSVSLFNLNKPYKIEEIKADPFKSTSYLLNNDNFLYLSKKGKIRMISTDGIRQERTAEDKGEGAVYRDFTDREHLAYLLGMYSAATQVKKEDGTVFWVTPTMLRTVEAKSSAPFVSLPVIPAFVNGQISKQAMSIFMDLIRNEVKRIETVKQEMANPSVKKVDGYHTGKKTKKGGYVVPAKGEDVSNWVEKPRGLYLFETAKMVGPLKADIEAGTIDEQAIEEQLNKYWNEQIQNEIDVLKDTGLIGVGPTGNVVNRIAPPFIFEGIDGEKGSGLNLIKGNLQHNIGQILISDYLNTTAINTLLYGNESKLFKDTVDQAKRASGSAAMIVPMTVQVTAPKWGIDAPLYSVDHVTYRTHKGNDLFGNTIDTDDAQMYITEKALRYMLFGFGKLNQVQVNVLNKIKAGKEVTADEVLNAGGLKEKGPFNSYKLLHFDGETYIKCSAFPLVRDMVSIKQGDQWVANPEYIELHNLLNKMEEQEERQSSKGVNTVVFAHPDTASKAMKAGVVTDIDDINEDSFLPIPAEFTGLQMENPSNKVMITDLTQVKQQILAEQDDTTEVVFMGSDTDKNNEKWTIGRIKEVYTKSIAQRKFNNANNAANNLFDMGDVYIELQNSLDLQQITPKLGDFFKTVQETLVATGTDSHTISFYEVDEDNNPVYNVNFPSLVPKFTEMFLSYFSKGVLSEKVPGTSVALVSDYGIKKYKEVLSVWQETDNGYLPEYYNQPKTWRVFTTAEVKANPTYFITRAKKYNEADGKRMFTDVQVGDIILDDLRHNYPKYDSEGRYLGRYSEFMMPAHYKEVMDGIPEAYRFMMGVRVPSDDKHSFIGVEYVDTLPVYLGSVGIFPRELVRISGADFDIDKVYLSWADTFISGTGREAYGKAKGAKDQFREYVAWQIDNNKALKKYVQLALSEDEKVEQLKAELASLTKGQTSLSADIIALANTLEEGNIELVDRIIDISNNRSLYSRFRRDTIKEFKGNITRINEIAEELQVKRILYVLEGMRSMKLPSNSQEFEQRGGIELNNGVLNNVVLASRLAMLTNDHISADTVEEVKDADGTVRQVTKASILNQATDTQILKDVITNLYDIFNKIKQDPNRAEEDKRGIPAILDQLSDPVVDTNSILGKNRLYKNNKEGQRNIGAAVNAMLVHSILSTYGVTLHVPVFFNGKQYGDFVDPTTSDNIRKFAQISASVNAMTDNAKDPLAAKLGLNMEALGYGSAMVSIGIPVQSAILILMQPSVQEYFKQVKNIGGELKTVEEAKNSKGQLFKKILKSYKEQAESRFPPDNLGNTNQQLEKAFNLTDSKLLDNIAKKGKDVEYQYSALEFLSGIKQISEHMIAVSTITKLSKGLPTSFAEIDNILNTLDSIQEKEERGTAPFDIYNILTERNDIVAADSKITKQVMQLAKLIFTERTDVFSTLQGGTKELFVVPAGINEQFDKQLKDDLLSFVNIMAYRKYLQDDERQGTLDLMSNSLIYSNLGGSTIYDRVIALKDKLKRSTEEGNYLVDNYLFLVNASESKSKINELNANIWTKISQAMQERLAGSFMDLYNNRYRIKVQDVDAEGNPVVDRDGNPVYTYQSINTHADAVAMFYYLLVKDGGQYKNNSFIKYIDPKVFKDLLDSAGRVNSLFAKGQGTDTDIFGTSIEEVYDTFRTSYAEHIGTKDYTPEVELAAGSVVYVDNKLEVNIPDYVFQNEKINKYQGFALAGTEAMFPLYVRVNTGTLEAPLYKLFKLSTYIGPYGTRTAIKNVEQGHSATYNNIPWRGSYAQWKGGDIFGKMPVPAINGQYIEAENPQVDPTSPSTYEQPQDVPATVVQVQAQPEDWQTYLKNRGIYYMQQNTANGAIWLVQNINVDTVPQTIQAASKGQATTPEQYYQYLTGTLPQQSVPAQNVQVTESTDVDELLLGAKVWTEFRGDEPNVRGEVVGDYKVKKDKGGLVLILNVMEDSGKIWSVSYYPGSVGAWKFERRVHNAYRLLVEREQNQPQQPLPVIERGRYVMYNGETYIVTKQNANGTWQVYNPTKEGTAAKKSVSEKNIDTLPAKADIVEYKNSEYIVTPKKTIISLTSNKKMDWDDNNGDRKAILAIAAGTQSESPASSQQLSSAEWKEQLSAIYKEKGIARSEKEWTQEALNFRNSIRGTMNDQDIMNKIKECIN